MSNPKIFYDNRFADAAPSASATAANYSAANISDARAYTWWKGVSASETLTVDCGSAKSASYLIVSGHNLTAYELRASTDNFAASNILVASGAATSGVTIFATFASVSYRYWRLVPTSATVPMIAIVMAGVELDMPMGIQSSSDVFGRNVISTANIGENGHPLGSIINYEQFKQTLKFVNVTWAWLRATWEPAWNTSLRGSPFFYAWDATNYPSELYLLKAGKNFATPHRTGGSADLTFEVSGVI